MFQYAAGYALAKGLGVSLQAILDSDAKPLLDGWRIPECPILRRRESAVLRFMTQEPSMAFALRHPVHRSGFRRVYHQLGSYYDEGFFRQKAGVVLLGDFRNPGYFSKCADEIRAFFQPKKALSAPARRQGDRIRRTAYPVAVHIRRPEDRRPEDRRPEDRRPGDHRPEDRWKEDPLPILGRAYYAKAIRMIDRMSGGRARYFVFSDDVDRAVRLLKPITPMTVIDGTGRGEAMILMSRCRDQIIANSTFGWWGAWLNPREDKNVIAPRRWVSRSCLLRGYPIYGLIPDGWVTI